MKSIECEGDTIDQAIDYALGALRVERSRVQIEILNDAARGLFGIGGRKARIRATIRGPLFSEGDLFRTGVDVSQGTPTDGDPATLAPGGVSTTVPETGGDASLAAALLKDIISRIGIQCDVNCKPGDEPNVVVLEVCGDSGGLVIGRRGQTLDALEYLINRIVSHGEQGHHTRFTVDVERYRERRRQYLEELAARLVAKVRNSGRPVTLNPMSPRDRRTVHLAVAEASGVSTKSIGAGYYRKLSIVPAEAPRAQRRPRDP